MDLHELKSRLQQHLADGLVLIVGSGMSCAEGIPGMAELGEHLCENVPAYLDRRDADQWEMIAPRIQSIGLEAALLETAASTRLEALIGKLVGEYISDGERRIITEVFEGSRVLSLTRLVPHLLKPRTGVPIVTTNYDRLVEIAVEEAGLGVDTMFVGKFSGRLNERESRLSFCRDVSIRKRKATFTYAERACVYKPHGSLDWYMREERPVRYGGDLPDRPRLIITPGSNKFRNGYDSPFDVHRARANEAIDRARRFLILGYGFNDDHLETHLTPAIRRGISTLLITRSLTPKALDFANNNDAVLAIDRICKRGQEGTRVISSGSEYFYPNHSLWDIHHFISEVLEP